MDDSCCQGDFIIACSKFLAENNYFRLIEDRCKFFDGLQDEAFELVIPIDVFDLLNFHVDFGNLVLNVPLKASEVFRNVIFTHIREKGWLPRCKIGMQLSVRLRISRLPPFECYQLPSLTLYRSKMCQPKLIQLKGLISGISTIQKYLKSTKFECNACKKGEFTFLRHFGTSDKMLIRRSELNCKICSTRMEEKVSCRVLADKVVFYLMENELLKCKRISQSVVACARDELASGIQLGRVCIAVGIPIYDFKKKLHVFEVLSVTPVLRVPQMHKSPRSLQTIFPAVPSSIKALYHDRKDSSWSFVFSLTYAFAGNVTPPGTFHDLKLALLLGLVSSSNQSYSGLDLLVLGVDGLMVNRLLMHAGQFALKFSILNSDISLLPTPCKDRSGSGFIEGGLLTLCDGGVCLIPELLHTDKNFRDKIVQVLDSSISLTSNSSGLTSNQLLGHRTCQLWTYLETPCTSFSSPHISDAKTTKFNVVINLFPMVIQADVFAQSLPYELLVTNILTQAQCDARDPLISSSDFKQFLTFVRGLDVDLKKESQDLIRSYYIASRTSRCFIDSSFLMPRTSIKTITCMAESFAKLNMRQEVLESDALFAIYFYEEMLFYRTGVSVLGVTPSLHACDLNLHASIGSLVDEKLHSFREQLVKFLHKHCDLLGDCDIELED